MSLTLQTYRGQANRARGTTTKDADILAQAKTRLQRSLYRPCRYVSCNCHDGVLSLFGHLPSYYLKQVAQATVSDIDGLELVNNRIRVTRSPLF